MTDKEPTTLKELTNAHPTLVDALMEASGHLDPLDDRSFAIVEASQLEHSLQELLIKHMVTMSPTEIGKLFSDRGAPLQAFSAKILIGHAMGNYGVNTRADLNHIRDIRNAFAHARRRVSFASKAISDRCRCLRGETPKEARDTLPPIPGSSVTFSVQVRPAIHPARAQFKDICGRLNFAFICKVFPDFGQDRDGLDLRFNRPLPLD